MKLTEVTNDYTPTTPYDRLNKFSEIVHNAFDKNVGEFLNRSDVMINLDTLDHLHHITMHILALLADKRKIIGSIRFKPMSDNDLHVLTPLWDILKTTYVNMANQSNVVCSVDFTKLNVNDINWTQKIDRNGILISFIHKTGIRYNARNKHEAE